MCTPEKPLQQGSGLYDKDQEAIKQGTGGYTTGIRHIVPLGKFHRIGVAPPETFPNIKYDAPEEHNMIKWALAGHLLQSVLKSEKIPLQAETLLAARLLQPNLCPPRAGTVQRQTTSSLKIMAV